MKIHSMSCHSRLNLDSLPEELGLVPETTGIPWKVGHAWHRGEPEGQRLPPFTTKDGT